MSDFERALPPCRLAEIHQGDTLPRIAARELGDANRWPELIWLNTLTWPYVTGDPERVAPGVLRYGQLIKVPAPVGVFTEDASRGQVYERDCALENRLLGVDAGGDLSVVSGADNLRQQLSHRIATPAGQATRHPDYGCKIWRLVGTVNGPMAGRLGAEYVKSALASDYRVASVAASTAQITGDVVRVTAKAVAIEGGVVDVVIP
jgi:phage baseplate assembly protein W